MKTLTTLIAVFVIGTSAAQFEFADTNSRFQFPDMTEYYITVEAYTAFFNYRVVQIEGNTVYCTNADVVGCGIKKFKGTVPPNLKQGDVLSLRVAGKWHKVYKLPRDVEYVIPKEDFEEYLAYIRGL